MWLLDANLDVNLLPVFVELGVMAESALTRGWGDMVNGDLVSRAVDAGFTCLITRDRLFGQSAANALKRYPRFAIVIVRLPQAVSPRFIAEFRSEWTAQPILPIAGSIIEWPGPIADE